jgi:hypothetical protein
MRFSLVELAPFRVTAWAGKYLGGRASPNFEAKRVIPISAGNQTSGFQIFA